MKTNLYNQEGKVTGEVELPAGVFGIKINADLLHQAIVTQAANSRAAYAHTKNRGEVRGGGRKPWAQKHTGQARQGSIRSPQWRHGGIIFGPTPERVFAKSLNRAMKRKALFMALSSKVNDKELVVLEGIKLANPKTKEMAGVLKNLPVKGTVLIVLPKRDVSLERSTRNIPGISIIKADSLNTGEVLKAKFLLLFKDSIEVIKKTYKS